MRIPFVDLKAQYRAIRGEIQAALDRILENTAFIGGKPVEEFEKAFADYCNSRFCVGTSSGTSALHVALQVCGIGEGDEVITVPNTFIATTEAITQTGATIVFVDVDPTTFNIDPGALQGAITDRTKAVIPVHLYGQSADMDPILAIAERHGIQVIADAAQAVGGTYNGRKMGDLARVSCFSYYPGKNLGAYGDGGALVTNEEELADKARSLIDHGRCDKYSHSMEGYNYRLDAMQAAILHVKLNHLESWIESRRRVAGLYREKLQSLPIEVAQEGEGRRHVYHIFSVFHEDRDRLRDHLAQKGIATGIHYPIPLHLQEAYKRLGLGEGSYPVTEELAKRQISLPIYPEISDEQINHVVVAIAEALA